jgi:Uncharacterized conserved protein
MPLALDFAVKVFPAGLRAPAAGVCSTKSNNRRCNMKKEDYIWDYRNPYEWMTRNVTGNFPPMMITCAITGGVQGKEFNMNLPETAEEQADQVYEAYKAGAVSVHIHARVPDNLLHDLGQRRGLCGGSTS